MKIYEALGTTDTETTCELCGRADLKSTVALRDIEAGTVVHFGSDCAARATGWTVREVELAAVAADRAIELAAQAERDELARVESISWEGWLVERTGMTDVSSAIAELGGFSIARASYRDRA